MRSELLNANMGALRREPLIPSPYSDVALHCDDEDPGPWRARLTGEIFGELLVRRLRSFRKSVILCCRCALVIDAGKDEEVERLLRVTFNLSSGCVLTGSQLLAPTPESEEDDGDMR